jgi:hypothetical protein
VEDDKAGAAFEMAAAGNLQNPRSGENASRLASLLWRLRRTTTIASDLFTIQAKPVLAIPTTRSGASRTPADYRGR